MPELPEVETTLRGVSPHVIGKRVREVIVRDKRLRWPVPPYFAAWVAGRRIVGTDRRGKYLLLLLEGEPGESVHFACEFRAGETAAPPAH
jgi:formamidopyrimidine-DNA glycosylase